MQFDLEQAIAVLTRTPATLNSLLRDLPEEWIGNSEGPEKWNPYDVVGHLIHGEETDWIPRARVILEHGKSHPFEPFDRFAMFEKSKGKTLNDLLDEFQLARSESIQELRALNITSDKLLREGMHPALGLVNLGQLLSTWVVHDLNHLGQIIRVMSKQYSQEVGPWKAYLSILNWVS
ncbi:MAG TPA: DinB family protein [Blastocatellia bacterium]|nr:DinB family protein [Blastocatellia bacterium]